MTERTALGRVWAYGDIAAAGLLIAGALTSVFGAAAGAVIMLAGLALALAIHLVVGVIGYRRVMTREWPKVAPLEDEW